MKLDEIQAYLRKEGLDGWLFFDHHRRDALAYRVLGIAPNALVTRRWYYLIPAQGEPKGLVHRIESSVLDGTPGEKRVYSSWKDQASGLAEMLTGCTRVAMQYSPQCAIPYVSMVDAGTVELVRTLGGDVVSSANLIQQFEARWTPENLKCHMEAARKVDAIRRRAFELAGERLRSGTRVTEFDLKQFIREAFDRDGLVTDHGPIVAVNANASNPHYEPEAGCSAEVKRGDVLLIDLWAKTTAADGVYYDITWTGFCGPEPPSAVEKVFRTVTGARDRAIETVQNAVAAGRELRGFEVDDAARSHIAGEGYGQYFVHRTGHSIGSEVHGTGANMDNLETHDERRVIPWTCFSIEPGVYVPEFGIRSEVDVFVDEREARVTGEKQDRLVIVG